MNLRLLSGNVCVATKTLRTDSDYSRVAHAPMLIFNGRYFSFTGIFDNAVNFAECEIPVMVDGFVTPWAGGDQ